MDTLVQILSVFQNIAHDGHAMENVIFKTKDGLKLELESIQTNSNTHEVEVILKR